MMRKSARQTTGVALFPFLAVLICTMGALIVLLVLLVQQARVDASSLAAARTAERTPADADRLRQQLEDAQWRQELLVQTRSEKTQELAELRLKLAHLEDHLTQLKEQAQRLMAKARAIDEGKGLAPDELAAARAELARLQEEIARQERELDLARKKHAASEQWYALIPYDGPQGTRRRPIYLECTIEGVIIQPEGIVFSPEDFAGTLGPGNPLDSALRAIREHLHQTGGTKHGEPYPLLVVRPSGVVAYAAARAALAAWDDEFGYELIGDDKKLDFGAPDAGLAAAAEKSVASARKRQAAMAAMMPRRFQGEAPLASFAPDALSDAPPRAAGSGGGLGVRGGGYGTGVPGGRGSGLAEGTGQPFAASAGVAGGGALGRPAGAVQGPAGGPNAPSPGGLANGATSQSGYGEQQGGLTPSASGGNAAVGAAAAGSASGGASGARGTGQSAAGQSAGGAPAGSTSQASKLTFGSQRPGSSHSSAGAGARSSRRGSNWGLPGAAGRTTAVTRPIRVAVLPNRVVIVPERGDDRPVQSLPLGQQLTPEDVNRFVAAIQSEVKGWGLAVADGYWKPVLQVDVAAGGERHFEELTAALEGSGFEIQRKSP
jgi:hypothetical protein